MDPKLKRKLARGREEIDATIDLHGLRQANAHHKLIEFIHAAIARGDRNVLVITGKGLTRASETPYAPRGVLRQAVPEWLSAPEMSALIAGFGPAAQGHGGGGALYVRLKRQRP